jgi:putative glutamine amidotransferase
MKKIGIVGSLRGDTLGIPYSYADFITRNLGEIIILTCTSAIREDLDLLILPGGADVNPERYGAIPDLATDSPDIYKEFFDLHHLPLYISKKIPIFGICRGIQTLNVHFGGTLLQDMPYFHETNDKANPNGKVHPVFSMNKSIKLEVNSRHHQAIDDLGEGLIPLFEHTSGIIEAVEHRDLPILAVQWHPEDLYERKATEWLMIKLKQIMKT